MRDSGLLMSFAGDGFLQLCTFDRDLDFFKADHEADYKQLPMDVAHSKLAAIALRSPLDNRRYGFVIRTMVFGDVDDVLHYNVFPRLISEIPTHLFGTPYWYSPMIQDPSFLPKSMIRPYGHSPCSSRSFG